MSTNTLVAWFKDLKRTDVPRVGGKNASLGELLSSMQGQAQSGQSEVVL